MMQFNHKNDLKKYLIKETKRLVELWDEGWIEGPSGHLVKDDKTIPQALVGFLGTSRQIRPLSDSIFLDETGYYWPKEAFIGLSPKIGICGCGARHTSFPNHHLPQCDLFDEEAQRGGVSV
jgi:hypothetical protein